MYTALANKKTARKALKYIELHTYMKQCEFHIKGAMKCKDKGSLWLGGNRVVKRVWWDKRKKWWAQLSEKRHKSSGEHWEERHGVHTLIHLSASSHQSGFTLTVRKCSACGKPPVYFTFVGSSYLIYLHFPLSFRFIHMEPGHCCLWDSFSSPRYL